MNGLLVAWKETIRKEIQNILISKTIVKELIKSLFLGKPENFFPSAHQGLKLFETAWQESMACNVCIF